MDPPHRPSAVDGAALVGPAATGSALVLETPGRGGPVRVGAAGHVWGTAARTPTPVLLRQLARAG